MDVSEFSDDYLLANVAETERLASLFPKGYASAIVMQNWHERLKAEAVRRGLLGAEERVSDAKEQEG